MTEQHFLHEGEEGVQKLSRQADHTWRGCGGLEASRPTLHAQAADTTCSTGRGREGTLNSKGSISQRGTYLSTSKKMALTFAGDVYTICFQKWGRKLVTKKVPVLAGWERDYGYEGEKGGGAEQEPES